MIVIFFLVYTASALAAGGKLFHAVIGVDYKVALTIGAVVILLYTFMGGFMAVCLTDFIQGTLMLIALLVVPIIAYASVCAKGDLTGLLEASQVAGGTDAYLNLWYNGGEKYRVIDIISQLAWGLGYCGMPHILTRFMAVKSQKELNKSKSIAIIWVALSLARSGNRNLFFISGILFKPGSYYHCKSLHKGTGRRNSSGICRCCR